MIGTIEERSLAYKILDGVMLSDGSLFMQRRSQNAAFRVSQSGAQHADWLRTIRSSLLALGVDCPDVKLTKAHRSNGETYDYLYLLSRVSELLTREYRRWYPSGRKEVPRDLELNPVSLAHFFVGDGSSSWRAVRGYVTASFCVQGFPQSSIEFVAELLSSLGVSTSINCRNVLVTSCRRSVTTLMDLVEPHMPTSYRYKIKRPMG